MSRYRHTTNPAFDNRQVAGAPDALEAEDRPQTFAADIFVPLLQNIIGGAAVAGLCAIIAVAGVRWAGSTPPTGELAVWSLLAGGALTCVVTVLRFFGDDIGLLHYAYRRGQESTRLRISALELELQAAQMQIARLMGKTKAMPSTAASQQLERVYKAAEQLIRWHFEALPIDRRSCESRNMSQAEWRRARHLLLVAGIMDGNGITVQTLSDALAKAHSHYQRLLSLGGDTRNFVSPV